MAPRFSILTPVYETPADVLRKMLRSVRRQSYGDWELCLVDDGSQQPHVREILDAASRRGPAHPGRLPARRTAASSPPPTTPWRWPRASSSPCSTTTTRSTPTPSPTSPRRSTRNPEADYVYTDEDKIDLRGRHSSPFFKPDWSPERMRTQMYTCHLSVLRRALVEEVGGFDADFEGSQDWDLVLKVTERARAVVHVPRVLYHWRMLENSAAASGEAKPWAAEAGVARGPGPLRPDRPAGARWSWTRSTPASSTSSRG